MREIYAVCPVCHSSVVEPTVFESRLDERAQQHARVTGHPVDVLDVDDPDDVLYRVPGEPALEGLFGTWH